MPQSTVASQPALQWVNTLTISPRFFDAIASISFKPLPAMPRLISTSCSTISSARA
ncbi:hypothetical protein ABIG07_003001 [Bradyrhizobium ottawaense]|uniref:Uncharacterized protein n=1 Tax=Bradyrhizobium ottawaense TaxID=931866 RepID=A0ABV4FT05_9BRAD